MLLLLRRVKGKRALELGAPLEAGCWLAPALLCRLCADVRSDLRDQLHGADVGRALFLMLLFESCSCFENFLIRYRDALG